MPGIDDITIGFCPDCKTFWCLECGAIFERGQTVCGHWAICGDCDYEEVEDDYGEIIEGDCGVLASECEKIGKWRWGPDFKKTSPDMDEEWLEEVKAFRLTPDMIRGIRKKLGISQRELGIFTRSSLGTLLSWEKGKFKPRGLKKETLMALRDLSKRDLKKILAKVKTKETGPEVKLRREKPGKKVIRRRK